MKKKLVLETTSPFQGLPELVAYDERLFEREGLDVEWADRDEAGVKTADTSLTDVRAADPFASHGSLSNRARPTCTTPANGATTAAPAQPASAAGRSAAAR